MPLLERIKLCQRNTVVNGSHRCLPRFKSLVRS